MNLVNYVGRTAYSIGVRLPYCLFDGLVNHTAKAVVGVAASGLAILTLGQFDSINKKVFYIDSARYILPHAFDGFKFVVNPPNFNKKTKLSKVFHGVLRDTFVSPIYEKAKSSYKEDSFFTKHIISRGAYALAGLASIIARTADLILGLIAAPLAIFPYLGRCKKVNQFAVNQLSSLDVIEDICFSLGMFIHPGWKEKLELLAEDGDNDKNEVNDKDEALVKEHLR